MHYTKPCSPLERSGITYAGQAHSILGSPLSTLPAQPWLRRVFFRFEHYAFGSHLIANASEIVLSLDQTGEAVGPYRVG